MRRLRPRPLTPTDESNELSAFGPGHLAGQAVLDSVRAVLAFNQSQLDAASTRVAAIGYSGGALATGWAAALQPTYAPDVELIASSFGGTCVASSVRPR